MARHTVKSNFRYMLEIQSPHSIPDDGGGSEKAWQGEGSFWGNVRDSSEYEQMIGAQLHQNISHVVEARYAGEVNSTWRIRWQDEGKTRYLSIIGVKDVNTRHRLIKIKCEEVIPRTRD